MKRQVRRNVFETNSSSTHSICVVKDDFLDDLKDVIYFHVGEFGWEYNKLYTPEKKASYLYTAILENNKLDLIEDMQNILIKNNIEFKLGEAKINEKYGFLENGFIDHSEELDEFLNICKDENKLMRFLFSSKSYIVTGNDNSHGSVAVNPGYPHDDFFKGN